MGPYSGMVSNSHISFPDQRPILRAHGVDLNSGFADRHSLSEHSQVFKHSCSGHIPLRNKYSGLVPYIQVLLVGARVTRALVFRV